MLSATIPNAAALDAVEACFSHSQLRVSGGLSLGQTVTELALQTFVAQNEDDYQLLNKLVNDTGEALGRKVRIPTWYRPWREGAGGSSPLTEAEVCALRHLRAAIVLTSVLDEIYRLRRLRP